TTADFVQINSGGVLGTGGPLGIGTWIGFDVEPPNVSGGATVNKVIGVDIGTRRTKTVASCTSTAGSPNVSTSAGLFNQNDVGALVIAFGANGGTGAPYCIKEFTDSTHVVMSANMGNSLTTTLTIVDQSKKDTFSSGTTNIGDRKSV